MDWADAPAMTAAPAELLAAATAAPRTGLSLLVRDATVTVDGPAHATRRWHTVYTVPDQPAAEAFGSWGVEWNDSYQSKPELQARLVAPDGTVTMLGPEAVTVVDRDEPHWHAVELAFGTVAAGSVVEVTATVGFDGIGSGIASEWPLVTDLPILRQRIEIDAPPGVALQAHLQGAEGAPQVVRDATGAHVVLTLGPVSADPAAETDEPGRGHRLLWSTYPSWAAASAAYGGVVDAAIAGADVHTLVDDVKRTAHTPRELTVGILRRVASLHRDPAAFARTQVVPRSPAETLASGGTVVDLAALELAALRAAGVPAELALATDTFGAPIEPDVPTIRGYTRLLLHVGGGVDAWVDPYTPEVSLGTLPFSALGQWALPLHGAPAAPSRLPATGAATFTQDVQVHLAEHGRSDQAVTYSGTGWVEATLRGPWLAGADGGSAMLLQAKGRAAGVGSILDAGSSDATDPATPIHAHYTLPRTAFAESTESEAVAVIDAVDLFSGVSDALTQPPDPPRTHPVPTHAYHGRLTAHVTVPDGFVPGTLPTVGTIDVGAFHLVGTVTANADHSVDVRVAVDTDEGELSAADVTRIRTAIAADRHARVAIPFDQVAAKALQAGRTGEGLRAWRDLAAAHPEDGYRLAEYGIGLVRSGLGEAGRARLRQARTLAPDDAMVAVNEGIACITGVDGTVWHGFDRACARAAFEDAVRLDPQVWNGWRFLALLHEHGDDGNLWTHGADLAAAVTVRLDHLPDAEASDVNSLLTDLVELGHYDTIAALVPKLPESTASHVASVTALVLTGQAGAAFQELVGIPDDDMRRDVLRQLGWTLGRARAYPPAALFLSASASGAKDPAGTNALAQLYSALRPYEQVKIREAQPESTWARFWIAWYARDLDLMAKVAFPEVVELNREVMSTEPASGGVADVPAFLTDYQLTASRVDKAGSTKTGWRMTWRAPTFVGESKPVTFYVLRDADHHWKVRATVGMTPILAKQALAFVDAGDEKSAATWLGWADDEAAGDPWWHEATGVPEATRLRLGAAARMAVDPITAEDARTALASLAVEDTRGQELLARSRIAAALTLGRWDEVLTLGRARLDAHPDDVRTLGLVVAAYTELGRKPEAVQLAETWHTAHPDDEGTRVLSLVYVDAHRAPDAIALLRGLDGAGHASAEDLNNLAWNEIFADPGHTQLAIDDARRSCDRDKWADDAAVNTLAAALAAAGRGDEAYVTFQRTDDKRPDRHREAWTLVRGWIAEAWGLSDVAAETYGALPAPEADASPGDVRAAAAARAKALKK